MKTYIVPIDIEVEAEDAENALTLAREAVNDTYNLLVNSSYDPDIKAASIIGSAEYREPYVLDDSLDRLLETGCIYDHDHSVNGGKDCEWHD